MTKKIKSQNNDRPDFSSLADNWPSKLVAREEVKRFTGGVIHPKSLENLDSRGEGPRNRIRTGKKISYYVEEFITWLENRSEIVR